MCHMRAITKTNAKCGMEWNLRSTHKGTTIMHGGNRGSTGMYRLGGNNREMYYT